MNKERLSDDQVKDLIQQVDEEDHKNTEALGPITMETLNNPSSEQARIASDGLIISAFRQGLEVTVGQMLPILHLPSGRVVQFQIKEDSGQARMTEQ